MTKQTEAHLDSRRLEKDDRPYGDYLLQLSDAEAVERSPFRQTLIALGWLGLTEITIYHPSKENDNTKWVVFGRKEVLGSELLVSRDHGGVLAVNATISARGERQLDFTFGFGREVECDPDDLNESIWVHLETIHHSLSEGGEGRNLNRSHFGIPDSTSLK